MRLCAAKACCVRFGSMARDEATSDSDLDIMVDIDLSVAVAEADGSERVIYEAWAE